MAERRMFTEKITESDAFLEMPLSTQALYFHLCMNADDDGFVKNPSRIQRMIGANKDDERVLITKSFILPFESGVIVIKHWRMHNLLRKDRYKETEYKEEKSLLYIKENGAYTFDEKQGKLLTATKWQPNGNQMATQDSIESSSSNKVITFNNLNMSDKEVKEKVVSQYEEDNGEELKKKLDTFLDKFGIVLDNYDTTITEMDFDLLTLHFDESEWLKENITSFKKVCELYPKIISGYYKEYKKKPKDNSYQILKDMLAEEIKKEKGENGNDTEESD